MRHWINGGDGSVTQMQQPPTNPEKIIPCAARALLSSQALRPPVLPPAACQAPRRCQPPAGNVILPRAVLPPKVRRPKRAPPPMLPPKGPDGAVPHQGADRYCPWWNDACARQGENRDQLFGWYPGREGREFLAHPHSASGCNQPEIHRISNNQFGPIGADGGHGLTSAASSALRPSYPPPRHRRGS